MNENEHYSVSISDWISILQNKTTTNTNLLIFFASTILGAIIIVPQLVRDSMGSNLYSYGMIALLLILLYVVYRLVSRKTDQENQPYMELYNKIILGEITDTKKIREEYKKIEEEKNNEEIGYSFVEPKLKGAINYTPKLNIVIVTILFLITDILLIFSTKLDNLYVLALVNSIFVLHIFLWLHVGDFKVKDNLFKGYVPPLLLAIIFFFIVIVIDYLINLFVNNTFGSGSSGVIWIYTTLLLGIMPIILAMIYTLYALIKDGNINDSYFKRRRRTHGKILTYTWFVSLLLLFLIILSPLISNGLNYAIKDNSKELHNLVNNLTKDTHNDTEKTLSLLSWFDRGVGKQENMANVYYRIDKSKQSDNDVLLRVGGDFIYIFSKYPNFCTRFHSDDPNLIFASRCGACGEFSSLFNTMGNYAGLEIRRAVCLGEDHLWNEVKINGKWIVVDSTAVNLSNSTGFNLSTNFMEEKIKGDLRGNNIKVDEGNVSYVYAIYPNAPNNKVDITERYTNRTNITVLTVDKNHQPIDNVTIEVYSNNRLIQRYTGLTNKTNNEGIYTFTIGGGNYTFKASINNLYGENTSSFIEKEPSHNITIELNNRN